MLAFGGPGSLADVGRFIETMTGAAPAPEVLAAVARRYGAIGGGSPLPEITARQAAALQAAMVAQLGVEVRVRPGYLYSAPTVTESLAELDPRDTAVLPMSPFSSRFTTGAYRAALIAAGRGELSFVDGWHADRRYLAALGRRLHETLDGADANEFAVLFTAHNMLSRRSPRAIPTSSSSSRRSPSCCRRSCPATGASPFRARGGAAANG